MSGLCSVISAFFTIISLTCAVGATPFEFLHAPFSSSTLYGCSCCGIYFFFTFFVFIHSDAVFFSDNTIVQAGVRTFSSGAPADAEHP
jgi:hypothetical protein